MAVNDAALCLRGIIDITLNFFIRGLLNVQWPMFVKTEFAKIQPTF